MLFIEMRKHFRVGSAPKRVSLPFELQANFAIVIDLAIQDYGDSLVLVEDRLFAGNEIDDG